MGLLYLLEKIRFPLLDNVMLLITTLGEETALLVAALIMFWCVSKRGGYYILGVGFLGTIGNQFLKLLCRVPRPWVLDPEFTILEQAREAAGGYSFPSGHTQSAFGVFGCIGMAAHNKCLKAVCVALAVLVGFSRMYIGVHTPQDVLVGALMAIILVVALYAPMMKGEGKAIPYVLIATLITAVAYLSYVEFYPFPADIDAHNLQSGIKNAYTLLGSSAGILVVYFVEKKYINFETKAVWWAQVIKVIAGLLIVLAVKEGLRSPLDAILNGHMAARALRYFVIVLVAGLAWPLSFRFFSRLGRKGDK